MEGLGKFIGWVEPDLREVGNKSQKTRMNKDVIFGKVTNYIYSVVWRLLC